MILVLGGTTEAKQVIELLIKENFKLVVSTAYDFAKEYIPNSPLIELVTGKLDSDALQRLIKEKSINAVVDATHPFAIEISKNAEQACLYAGIKYLRLERGDTRHDIEEEYARVQRVDSIVEAAKTASNIGRVVFFATGSNGAGEIAGNIDPGCKRYIRILPNGISRARCLEAGFKEYELIEGVGPYSYEDNYELWKQLKVDVVVTKESGSAGGFTEKLDAAKDLGIYLVVIDRPKTKGINIRKAEEVVDVLKALHNT